MLNWLNLWSFCRDLLVFVTFESLWLFEIWRFADETEFSASGEVSRTFRGEGFWAGVGTSGDGALSWTAGGSLTFVEYFGDSWFPSSSYSSGGDSSSASSAFSGAFPTSSFFSEPHSDFCLSEATCPCSTGVLGPVGEPFGAVWDSSPSSLCNSSGVSWDIGSSVADDVVLIFCVVTGLFDYIFDVQQIREEAIKKIKDPYEI